MFDSLLLQLNKSIIDRGGKEQVVPNHLKECLSINGKSKISSWLWDVPRFRRWRVTTLDAGKRLQVLNSVAYPSYETDFPIMGIDLLWFESSSKLVAVLDFQPLVQDPEYLDRYFQEFKILNQQFTNFNSNNSMHSYDPNQYFSPWLLFCKGGLQSTNLLPEVFSSFLSCYLESYDHALSQNHKMDPEYIEALHIAYDKYSSDRDPAHGLFSGFFGKKWANQFVHEFLFPLSI